MIPFHRATGGKAPRIGSFRHYDPAKSARLPAAGSAVVDLAAPTAADSRKSHSPDAARERTGAVRPVPVRAGTLPFTFSAGAPAAGARKGAHNQAIKKPGTAAGRIRITLTSQKTALAAGIHGILFSVSAADATAQPGPVNLTVDDSSFRYAYGGDYASRLHLVSLPACALTTPEVPACQKQTPLKTSTGSALTTTVPLGSTKAADSAKPAAGTSRSLAAAPAMSVMAATSGAGGSSGDYTATSLTPSGSWSTSGNTGSFRYDYPVQVPAPVAGPGPKIQVGYDSSSQDGRTEGTNNQSSWIGDGWDTSTSGFVERTYANCSDDTDSGAPQYSNDQCWAGQILTLSLNGKSSALVYDDDTHTFHPKDDNGEKVENLKNCTNGTYNKECWRITTTDGTQYYFGMNQLPGWSSGKPTTQSAWTLPVYGGHSGDPCHADTFAASSCDQGWRWNLDYVVDLHGNAAAYYYTPETNHYGADMKTTPVSYVRGGYLNRIDYGMTASTVYSDTAPEQVVFNTAERCIPGTPSGNTCADSQFTTANAAYWPDVPIDLNCAATGSCSNHGPSFWSRKRLASIVTQIQVGGSTQKVDEYDFTQSFPDGGDHAPTLWLDSVQRKGLDTSAGASGTITQAPVSFDPPLQLPNRVGTVDNIPLMYHDRIQDVTTETGAQIAVTYNKATCTPDNVPSDPATNTADCYPVYWTPPGNEKPLLDWFQKYTVKSVLTQDTHNKNPDGSYPELLTSYSYGGGAAWHYDDNETVKAKNRTYGQFRGYATVETRTGDPNVFHVTDGTKVFDRRTLNRTTYLRGMDQNNPKGSGGSTVKVTSRDGKYSVTDSDELAGLTFETDTYTGDGDDATVDTAAVSLPTVIGPTATRKRSGLPALESTMVREGSTHTRQAVTGGWRNAETDTFYDTTLDRPTTGMPLQADDRGDVSDATQAQCTWTRYLENPAKNLVVVAETVVAQQDCHEAGASRTGTLVTDARTSYDQHGFTWNGASPAGDAPTLGDASLAELAKSVTGGKPDFVALNKMTYDGYGRPAVMTRTPNSTAADGSSLAQTTTTTYTPTSGALPTQTSVRTQVTAGDSAKYQTLATTFDPARGLATTKVDPAGLRTDLTYDALGRLTAVWLPNESKAASAPANMTFGYHLSATGPSVISTNKLLDDGSYSTQESLFDALLRERQRQTTAEASNTTVSDTQYDSHGWKVVTHNAYSVSGAPGNDLVLPAESSIPDTTVTDYDDQGRPGLVTSETNGSKTSAVVTAFAGDRTTVVQPQGGVTQTTLTDGRGKTTELDQYTTPPTVTGSAATGFHVSGGTTTPTKYGWDPNGQQSQITGPDGSQWKFEYDLLGHKTTVTDPDAGTTHYGYDDAGNQISVKDARNIELDYTYDLLGRKLTGTDKNNGDAKFASWTYDTVQTGQLTSSTRYTSAGNYTFTATGYTSLGYLTGSTLTLPSGEAPLPTSYTVGYSYSTHNQLMTGQTDPKVGSALPGEQISYGHDAFGSPTSTTSGLWSYLSGTTYTPYNEPSQLTLGPSNNPAYVTYSYDNQTRRMTEALTTRTQAPGPTADDVKYSYDAVGNPTSVADQQSETGKTVTDTQCFQYDALDRLSQAWTAAGSCPKQGTDPTPSSIATGTGAYWQSFQYDAIGNRKKLIDHAVNGATGDTTTDYTLGCAGTCPNGPQPHSLTAVSSTGPNGTVSQNLGYDESGNTTGRSVATTGPLVSGVKTTGGAALCANDANGSTTDGNPVQIAACSGGTAQNWSVGTDGTVRALGKCLDVKGGATAGGTPVDLTSCNGGAGQQWRTQSGGALVNPASGRCLDDPSGSQTAGTQLDIADCSGAAGQRWTTANAANQPTSDSTQALKWDDEGHLGSITTSVNGKATATTSFVYDADGKELIRRDPTQTTLFVGDTQIVVNTAVTPHVLLGGVRTYCVGGGGGPVIAQRSTLPGGGVSYLLSDNHGTPTMSMDVNTQAVSRTEYQPFGAVRARTGSWPTSSRGFLGTSTEDSTGYTDVGARKYDPLLGRFMSGDPVLTADNPQEMNGYGYASENPLARSDVSGTSSIWGDVANYFGSKAAHVFVVTVDHTFHPIGEGMRKLDPVFRKCMPKSIIGTPDDPTAVLIGWEWATNTGPRHRDLDGSDRFTQTLQKHRHVEEVRKDIAKRVNSGELKVGSADESPYKLGGNPLKSIANLASDFTSNLSAAFLGSYKLQWKITGLDKKAGNVTVQFKVDNPSTINSAVHTSPALGGYSKWWNDHIATPLNERFSGGVMSKRTQTITWTETFSLSDPQPSSGGGSGGGSGSGGGGGGDSGGISEILHQGLLNKLRAMERQGF
ncbi:ricin-type beta-trefoil lectin domain protein [Streptomyces sp. NPDC086787]|uniref:ricin-type beta-trefoil lectin domain protein n=1 Tax=Streptomyces sp. NPDC086787 TaxID=3365759 RepID=UPI003821EA0A